MVQYKEQIDQKLFERIESYLDQTMDAEKRMLFEQEMKTDEMLRNEVGLQRRLMAATEVFSYVEENQESDKVLHSAPVKKIRLWVLLAAATVIVCMITWFYSSTTPSQDKLFARYFVPDTGLPVVMSGIKEDYDFYNGMVSYKEEDYAKAIEVWKHIYNENTPNDTLRYFIGMAYLNIHNPEAITWLLPVAENENSSWNSKAIWYLALSYLKHDRRDDALLWLERLKGDEQATLLKKDIEKLSR